MVMDGQNSIHAAQTRGKAEESTKQRNHLNPEPRLEGNQRLKKYMEGAERERTSQLSPEIEKGIRAAMQDCGVE